jgi:peptidoglycan/LPS O-acetylase OafA/YrhL
MKEQNRLGYIDALRGVAVVLVIYHHFFQFINISAFSDLPSPLRHVIEFFIDYGASGVQIFFILSGFIIYSSSNKPNQSSSIIAFMYRRFSRLLPAMVLAIALSLIMIQIERGINRSDVLSILPSISFLDPVLFNKVFYTTEFHWIDGSMWSLFSEIRFYFYFAVFSKIFASKTPEFKLLALITFLSLGKVLAFLLGVGTLHNIADSIFISRDSTYFILGILLAKGTEYTLTKSLIYRVLALVFCIFLEGSFELNPAVKNYQFLMTLIVFVLITFPLTRLRFAFLAKYLGVPSYISYLIHLNLSSFAYSYFKTFNFYAFVGAMTITIFIFSYFFHKYAESRAIYILRML